MEDFKLTTKVIFFIIKIMIVTLMIYLACMRGIYIQKSENESLFLCHDCKIHTTAAAKIPAIPPPKMIISR